MPRFWSSVATLQRSSELLHTHSSPSLLLAFAKLLWKKASEEFLPWELYSSCNLWKIFGT
jgi:hypothetical protein